VQTPKLLLWLAAVSVAVVGVPVAIVVFTSESHPGQQAAAGSVPSPSPAASQSSPSASASPSHSTPPPSTPKKNIAMQLVSSAENSSLDWKAQYRYIEDIGDGRGYTGGIVGFCSGTHDMLELIQLYADRKPGNVLAKYLPALRDVEGSDSHAGLDPNFNQDWAAAAADPAFRQAQDDERDRVYFNPAERQAKADGLRAWASSSITTRSSCTDLAQIR